MEFSTELEVRIGDINYGNHLGNDSFIKYFHEARMRFFIDMGLSEGDIGEGAGIILTEIFCQLKSEVFYGELLTVTIQASEIKKASFKLEYKMTNQQDKIVAKGHTLQAAFNYQVRKVASLPVELKSKLESYV